MKKILIFCFIIILSTQVAFAGEENSIDTEINSLYAANKLDELESSGDFNSLDYQYFDGMFNSGEDPWDFGF